MYLYYIDNGLLCHSDFIYIVKKKQPIHPRLFIKCNYLNEKKTKLKLFFKSNNIEFNVKTKKIQLIVLLKDLQRKRL